MADTIAELTEAITSLSVSKENTEDVVEDVIDKIKDTEDDGYISEEKSEKSDEKNGVSEADDKTEDDEDDLVKRLDDIVLEPLSFVKGPAPVQVVSYTGKGPIDQEGHYNRTHPYSRPGHATSTTHHQIESCQLPQAVVLVLRKNDTNIPSKLDASVTWSNKHELCIDKYLLPEDTYFGEENVENKVQLFIQLNPNTKELKSFLADVKTEFAVGGESKLRYIGPIVISLKTELAESQEKLLLEKTTMEERTAAYNLVHQKEISQLTCGIGPHKDTVLSVLCAKRNPENPGQTYAQIHAVIQRLINHPDNNVKQTIFRFNNNQISAFEIAAITNNSLVACYLAEVMYNISEDTRSALRVLNCKDTQGNTILHLLARKGDSNLKTMRDLLNMRLTDGSNVFNMLPNSKKQFPIHIATQNVKNQPATIGLLFQHMPQAFEVTDEDGMTSLHYACQRTTDVELVRTVLSHKKNNINARTKDGLTALDLITRRCESTTQTLGLFAIEASQQAEIVLLVKNNGGKSGMVPEQSTNYQNAPPMTNMGYTNTGYSPSQPSSSEGSPYSCHQSNATSPHTPSLGSPCSLSNPSMNSVGSFPQSSPESTPHGSPAFVYQVPHSSNLDSPVPHQLSYEDHIASQILTQFPEIGHILDNQY